MARFLHLGLLTSNEFWRRHWDFSTFLLSLSRLVRSCRAKPVQWFRFFFVDFDFNEPLNREPSEEHTILFFACCRANKFLRSSLERREVRRNSETVKFFSFLTSLLGADSSRSDRELEEGSAKQFSYGNGTYFPHCSIRQLTFNI